ncbi:MAG: 2-amino-4-hydroxy-6-hydroxymethyldihydropteridine diphosphokinase [Bacteroidota bacterium]
MNDYNLVYLQLGSNMGRRDKHLQLASWLLAQEVGPILQTSQVYETAAWGITEQADFFNQVLLLQTALAPQELLNVILQIEQKMGRHRQQKWGPRLIDIDILFYGDQVIQQANLRIPHPEIQKRNFVLIPMQEIAGDLVHPVLGKTINELVAQSKDEQTVKLLQV